MSRRIKKAEAERRAGPEKWAEFQKRLVEDGQKATSYWWDCGQLYARLQRGWQATISGRYMGQD